MPATINCPNCAHPRASPPEESTYTAIAAARVTATIDGRGEVLDYSNTEIDAEKGYRDIRCEYCEESITDLYPENLTEDPYQPDASSEPARLRVRADVDLEVCPITVGRDAAAHAALVQAAEERELPLTTAADPSGAYLEGHVTGPASEVVPLLAALALSGNAYAAEIDTDDEEVMNRISRDAGGGIFCLKYEFFDDPPLR